MKRLLVPLAVVLAAVCAAGAWAANSVVVESRAMATNAVDCPIHVWVENDVELNALVVPLNIRDVTPGSYISALKLSWDERIYPGGPISDILYTQRFAEPTGTCRPGGYAYPSSSNDTLKHAVAGSPEGVMFAALSIVKPPLAPGSDVTGSMVLTMDATGPAGTFEIDTSCVDPGNHLFFVDVFGYQFAPSFSKGVITTHVNAPPAALCRDMTVAADEDCQANASIDNGSYDPDGGPVIVVQIPPGPYPLGQTVVQLIVTDQDCVSSYCNATVWVQDQDPPVIACPPDMIIGAAPGETGAIAEFEISAADNCGVASVAANPPSGSYFPIGISTVIVTATDVNSNQSICTFYVAVASEGGYCNTRPEDVNCDGSLDIFDLNQLIDALFMGVPESGPCCSAKK